jgi:glycosyltransferase involved in cell wall biosynthesis
LKALKPHVVITQGIGREHVAREALDLRYPVIMRLVSAGCVHGLHQAQQRSVSVAEMLQDPRLLVVSNSTFVASRVRELLGLESPVVHSLVPLQSFAVAPREPEFVTFVNPTKIKGVEIAVRVAALLPHRKFLFVESWGLDRASRVEFNARLARLSNVTFRRPSMRMEDVYRKTSVMLVPSQCEDSFPRVVIEAAVNGIPVVGSRIGGIPEALGAGGVLLSADDAAERWAEAIERLLSDNDLYARLSANALLSAARTELNPQFVAQRFLEIAGKHGRVPSLQPATIQ